MTEKTLNQISLLHDLVTLATRKGASAAEGMLSHGLSLNVACRGGKLEGLNQEESSDITLCVFDGKKRAVVSSTDKSPKMLDSMVERAIAMAKIAPEDKFAGIAEQGAYAKVFPDIALIDETTLTATELQTQAQIAEDAAMSIKGVTNSEGASASQDHHDTILVTSAGFQGHYRKSYYSLQASAIAGNNTGMEQDYDYNTCVFAQDMKDAKTIGENAGTRAVRKLSPRKMPSGKFPVIFENRCAGSILRHLASAISGNSIARGTSFLQDKMGQKIFSDSITITDDPHLAKGLRSRPFDGDGILGTRRKIIDSGILGSWFLNLHSARQLGLASTGHANLNFPTAPSPSNFILQAGSLSPADLIKDIRQGFFVTDLMGDGVNPVTGDYSRAASGFWIENGVITFAVSEMTIAGNLKDMFMNITPANDLEIFSGVDAPTLRIEGLMVAGV